eukprot:TRINITY_DN1013_c0_g1_i1.p1 TRINITY_DN1013_c0_g1~~TRINITY_DN1013_c0_g1_i1.p1  ORF type:complete len:373 (-),score=75.46 TRINITY_DN1013_c0_g1_i1:519-1637(-)
MADYLTSTQKSLWTFTAQELAEKREACNARAIESLHKYGTTKVEITADGGEAGPSEADQGKGIVKRDPNARLPEPLTCHEEALIQSHYEHKIQAVCAAFAFPNKIKSTALVYFKRFYLRWSVMQHDPKNIMLTCIYLACKIEEFHVSAEEFGKGIQQDPLVVLRNEVIVLQSLDFDLIVFGPYRCIRGFITDLEAFCKSKGQELTREDLEEMERTSYLIADSILLTDACLIYPPGQLALAAMWKANQELNKVDTNSFLRRVVQRQQRGGHSLEELTQAVDAISELERTSGGAPSLAEVKAIDLKLKICRNPDLYDGTDGKSREERKHRKRDKKRASNDMQGVDPGNLAGPSEADGGHEAKRRKSADNSLLIT